MLGMEAALGVLVTRGAREGKPAVADFAKGVWLELHRPLQKRLGGTEEEQIELLADCLQLLCERGFARYVWRDCRLSHTRKGWRARKAHIAYKKYVKQRQKAGLPVRPQPKRPVGPVRQQHRPQRRVQHAA